MLVATLSFHQVMPEYLNFIFVFGSQDRAKDIGFGGFREQVTIKLSDDALSLTELGRSGRQYQLCYNLKGVTRKGDGKIPEYSIRQAAFHHSFDVVSGNILWIVTKGRIDLEERFMELTGPNSRPEDKAFDTPENCFRASLSAHLMFCHWSTEDWRGYVRSLESEVQSKASSHNYFPHATIRLDD